MKTKLQKWGNSVEIRIPSSILKSLNLSIDDKIDLKEDGDRIIITKSKQERLSLKELFEDYTGGKLENDFE